MNNDLIEEYIIYRIGYQDFNGELLCIDQMVITDLKTALTVLENKRNENNEIIHVLVQENVKRNYLNV